MDFSPKKCVLYKRNLVYVLLETSSSTVLVLRMAHRTWKKAKQEPGTAEPGNMLGCCLNSSHFLWAFLSTSTVQYSAES